MTKLTLQEQMLKAGLVSSKKMAKVQRTAKKSRVQAREAREAVEENKKAQIERDKQLSEQQKQAALSKEYKAQIKQLIEMNKITITRGDIGYNFTDNNLIKKVYVDKVTQSQLIKGRLAIARLTAESGNDSEYAIIPAIVADKIAQRDASYIVLNCELSQEAKDEDDPYADFVIPDDLMWKNNQIITRTSVAYFGERQRRHRNTLDVPSPPILSTKTYSVLCSARIFSCVNTIFYAGFVNTPPLH